MDQKEEEKYIALLAGEIWNNLCFGELSDIWQKEYELQRITSSTLKGAQEKINAFDKDVVCAIEETIARFLKKNPWK